MKIVLLARHYPPAVSGGAKRPYLLATALRKAGADVLVCAPTLPEHEPGWSAPHPNRDPAVEGGSPRKGIRDIGRDWLLWPDPDIRWSMRAARTVLASGQKPDWVISTSPPESIHVAGEWLARKTGAHWMADFRDLWLESPHRRERFSLHRRIGERILATRLLPRARLTTAVDEVVAREVAALGGRHVHVLPHFASEFSSTETRSSLPQESLNVVHAGSISLSDPDARIEELLRAFETAREANPKLRLHFVGRLTVAEQTAASTSSAADAISVWGVVSLEKAYAFMRDADGLVFVASKKMHVPPSKIIDYMTFDAPIIACGDGPWRTDPRCPQDDPATAMGRLSKSSRRAALERPLTADAAAALLLGWMQES